MADQLDRCESTISANIRDLVGDLVATNWSGYGYNLLALLAKNESAQQLLNENLLLKP